MGDSHSSLCCGFMFEEIEVNTDPPQYLAANRKESEVDEEDEEGPPRLISTIVHDHISNTYNPDDENMEEPYYINYNAYESDGGLSGISEGTEEDETETDIDSDDNINSTKTKTTTKTKKNASTTISNNNKITYTKCNHLQHHYIRPIFYVSKSNKKYLITSTQTFAARNDEGAGIFLYDILENKWLKYASYPEYLEFNNHGHALDQYNHLLYIYQDLDRKVFTIFDIRDKKWNNMTINNSQYDNEQKQEIVEMDINDDADSTAEEPRLYQEINSLYIPSPFNELHFIANTNLKTHHFKYKPRGAGYYELIEMEMEGLFSSFVLNPKIVYVEYLNILIAFGGYNGSLHRDVSFLQYDNIWTCDLNKNIDENINEWKTLNQKLPFKSSMFDVILGFGDILFFFYGEKVICLDLFDNYWYPLHKKRYPLDECYDLMMINDDMNNIHFIHCANAMGPLSFGHFGGSQDNNDSGYHIKISLFDILPIKLSNKYKDKFPLLLYALIRNIDDFNDKIPNDLFKLILTYFHTLCV